MGQGAQRLDNRTVLWTNELKSETFRLTRRVYVWWRAATSSITPTIKYGGGSVMVWGRLLSIAKSGICTRWRANWIRPAITAYCSISWSHLDRSLWVKDLYSYKISKLCQRYLKSKEELHIFQLAGAIRGLKSHWTGMGWIWQKSHSWTTHQVQHTSGNSWRKDGQNYLQSTSSLWWKECQESVKQW